MNDLYLVIDTKLVSVHQYFRCSKSVHIMFSFSPLSSSSDGKKHAAFLRVDSFEQFVADIPVA